MVFSKTSSTLGNIWTSLTFVVPFLHKTHQACVSQTKTPEDFSGPKANFEIQFLSSGVEVFSSKTSAKFLVNVGFYCFAFKTNENWISVGKQNVPKITFRARKVFGSFEKRRPGFVLQRTTHLLLTTCTKPAFFYFSWNSWERVRASADCEKRNWEIRVRSRTPLLWKQ